MIPPETDQALNSLEHGIRLGSRLKNLDLNPFMPDEFHTIIILTNPFQIQGLLGIKFPFHSNLKSTF